MSKRTQQIVNASKTQGLLSTPVLKSKHKSLSSSMGLGHKFEHESFLEKGFPWTFVPAETCIPVLENLIALEKVRTSVPSCVINDYKHRYIPVYFFIFSFVILVEEGIPAGSKRSSNSSNTLP